MDYLVSLINNLLPEEYKIESNMESSDSEEENVLTEDYKLIKQPHTLIEESKVIILFLSI